MVKRMSPYHIHSYGVKLLAQTLLLGSEQSERGLCVCGRQQASLRLLLPDRGRVAVQLFLPPLLASLAQDLAKYLDI